MELRSLLDWVCTDSTLSLFHWLKMEDIYANIYILKCYRTAEKVEKVLSLSPEVLHQLLIYDVILPEFGYFHQRAVN